MEFMKYAELSGSSDQDILDYLKLHDLQYVDNRTKKGCLWIKGDKDISPIIKNIKKIYGISFIFKSEVKCLAGGPGWWLKERKMVKYRIS
ncbi:hypothetical protein [Ruminococcus sp.]|uniref:hypothetical protein n=1 Tax=Ruminococcus sp. TaxID=41978 RepID=UPI001B484E43|nr:hypothetical protein [Ruminococcus sp.]MBP5433573.1 hypothetical protein [Ruminococcus sp.]